MSFAHTPRLVHPLVTLAPLSHDHSPDLADAVAEGELWRTWYTAIPTPDRVAGEVDRRLDAQRAGSMAPWAVLLPSGQAVGMTTYMRLNEEHKRLEIGSTWLSLAAQGSGVNPAMKLLMLERAFEVLDCNVVELRTHFMNHQSRAAIERLGAKLDGVLRAHRVWRDGSLRDTAVYSITRPEWPAVRASLEARIERHVRTASARHEA